jgi:hypothetical protein
MQKLIWVKLQENAQPPARLQEAATIKSRVLRLSRELGSLLTDKTLPAGLRSKVESFQADLKKTWKELESEATQDGGHKAVASKEDGLSEWWDGEEYHYIPYNIISFEQLKAAEAAKELGETMRERVGQFTDMLNNIFWSYEVQDKLTAAQTLFDEFVGVIGDVLTGQDTGEDSMAGLGTEAEAFTESYQPAVSLVEAEGAVDPRGPLEMDVQLISPGWGNSRDNHYYPKEMLARDAHVFEGVKMYATDHKQEEKNVRSEVSKIKKIVGFTEAGAPIGRVVVFDPDFAEACRNRAKAGELESLECSILADGKARAGFELGGRKGKVVESIISASSVDWVTRAGAGGKALNLAESADGAPEQTPEADPAPVEETAVVTEPVAIHEGEAAPEETPPATEPVAETVPAVDAPVVLSREEIQAALKKTNLPAASVIELAFAEYATGEALQGAIDAEVKRIKEISGSGRPFGLGERAAVQSSQAVSRTKIEETMNAVNKKFGFGR